MSSSINATSNSTATISGAVEVQSKQSFTVTGSTVGTSEVTISVPSGAKAFRLQASNSAGAAVLTVSHTSGGTSVAGTSFDIFAGSSWLSEDLDGTGFSIYIKSSKASTPVQLLYWT